MQRRKALATAGGITVTALAATIALGANLGLFGLTNDQSGPGDFAPVSSATRTEVVDVPVPVTASTPRPAAGAEPRPAGESHSEEAHEHGGPEAHEDD